MEFASGIDVIDLEGEVDVAPALVVGLDAPAIPGELEQVLALVITKEYEFP